MKVSFFQFVLACIFLFACLFLACTTEAATVDRLEFVPLPTFVPEPVFCLMDYLPDEMERRLDESLGRYYNEIQAVLDKNERKLR